MWNCRAQYISFPVSEAELLPVSQRHKVPGNYAFDSPLVYNAIYCTASLYAVACSVFYLLES